MCTILPSSELRLREFVHSDQDELLFVTQPLLARSSDRWVCCGNPFVDQNLPNTNSNLTILCYSVCCVFSRGWSKVHDSTPAATGGNGDRDMLLASTASNTREESEGSKVYGSMDHGPSVCDK